MNGSGHIVPACYLELHEEGEVEISTCPPTTPLVSLFSSTFALYRSLADLPTPAEN